MMANRSPYVGMRTNRFPSTRGIVPWSQLSWTSTRASSKRLWDLLVKKSIRRYDYDDFEHTTSHSLTASSSRRDEAKRGCGRATCCAFRQVGRRKNESSTSSLPTRPLRLSNYFEPFLGGGA